MTPERDQLYGKVIDHLEIFRSACERLQASGEHSILLNSPLLRNLWEALDRLYTD